MHRGASWASEAAQAAQFVRSILRFYGLRALRGGLTRLEKPEIFNSQHSQTNPYHRPRLTGVASDSSPSAARSARSAAGVIARHAN